MRRGADCSGASLYYQDALARPFSRAEGAAEASSRAKYWHNVL